MLHDSSSLVRQALAALISTDSGLRLYSQARTLLANNPPGSEATEKHAALMSLLRPHVQSLMKRTGRAGNASSLANVISLSVANDIRRLAALPEDSHESMIFAALTAVLKEESKMLPWKTKGVKKLNQSLDQLSQLSLKSVTAK